ncbi:MAG: murein biosynthesis integral membrane protein MurJ [Acidobacteriota bacterium]
MSTRIARSAGIIGIATMASRLLGVAREVVLAALFGAGTSMDAFNVAFRIPNLLRDLFAEGAMTAAFIPTFTRTLAQGGREQAWRLGNLVLNALLVVTGIVVVVGVLCAGPITHLIASGDAFAAVPGKLELTTLLTRLMLPFLTTIAVAVAMMGMLNSLHRFFIPALAPAMFNLATIACAFTLVPLMPRLGLPPIAGIAIGTLFGGLGQIALQWPPLRKEGYRYRPILDFKDPALREVLRLMGPGTLGLAAVQFNVFVNTYLATTQPEGAVSWLGYAFRLMYLPIGLFGASIATAAVPDISRHAADGDVPAIRRTVSSALRLMLMLNVPATVGLIVLADPIVAFLLQRHAFTGHDTRSTAAALMCYAPGLIGYSVVKIASPTFYSLRDSRTPAIVAVLAVAANLAMNLALVRVLGFRGLAIGTALAALFNAGALLWLLARRLDGIEGRRIATATLKILLASILMGIVAWSTSHWLTRTMAEASFAVKGFRLAAAIAAGVAVLAASARLLRIAEFEDAVARVLDRVKPAR